MPMHWLGGHAEHPMVGHQTPVRAKRRITAETSTAIGTSNTASDAVILQEPWVLGSVVGGVLWGTLDGKVVWVGKVLELPLVDLGPVNFGLLEGGRVNWRRADLLCQEPGKLLLLRWSQLNLSLLTHPNGKELSWDCRGQVLHVIHNLRFGLIIGGGKVVPVWIVDPVEIIHLLGQVGDLVPLPLSEQLQLSSSCCRHLVDHSW